MRKILAGVETEYGLHIQGRGAHEQVEDATEFVKSYPAACFIGWDYRYESPRSDLRGFKVDRLQFDPEDAKFDMGKAQGPAHEVRADRVLPNGARLYNDHGHPEYATPECLSLSELSLHDRAGQLAILKAAIGFSERSDAKVSVYKNNTDFHGASYGTHEGYLVPRELPFERLHESVLPILISRQILTGAGKVGSEDRSVVPYQLSQRADFFVETTNVETLYRRPIFNTRDEPHADASKWVRLHVISGDANMIRSATERKVGLVKLAIALAEINEAPQWKIPEPVNAFKKISRDMSRKFVVDLEGQNWTTAAEILESYFSAAERFLDLDPELEAMIRSSRRLLTERESNPESFRREVDWAAKQFVLEQVIQEENLSWDDPALRSYDLEYHNIDPEESLFSALQDMGLVEVDPPQSILEEKLLKVTEGTRARARGIAVEKFKSQIETLSWTSIVFKGTPDLQELLLPPDLFYSPELERCDSVGTFIETIMGVAK